MPTYSSCFLDHRGVCGEQAPVMFISACIHQRLCTQALNIYITGIHIAQYFRGAHNSWKTGPFGATIAAMMALAHADLLQLFSEPPEACAANDRRWCIYSIVYITGGCIRGQRGECRRRRMCLVQWPTIYSWSHTSRCRVSVLCPFLRNSSRKSIEEDVLFFLDTYWWITVETVAFADHKVSGCVA